MTEQKYKADARQSARQAPEADPDVADRAIKDAKGGEDPKQQPVYKTQTPEGGGENIHRDKDDEISEFDDPASHTVQEGKR